MKFAPCLLAITLSFACGDSHDLEMDAGFDSAVFDSAVLDSATPDTTAEPDAGPQAFPPERALLTEGSCDRIAGYEFSSSEEPALIWSKAHAFVRAFADHGSPWAIDGHLVAALSEDLRNGVVTGAHAAFSVYAERVPNTCYAGIWTLPEAVYETTRDDIQWLRPGVPVVISSDNVILDLRNVPEGPSLDAFLADFTDQALGRIDNVEVRYRSFNGQPDEGALQLFAPGTTSRYAGRVVGGILTPIIGGSNDTGIRIGILLGERVAPSAARFALALRLDERAAILGESLPVSVAERMANPASDGGLFTRVFEIVELPDEIDADVAGDEPERLEEAFLALGDLDAITGDSSRGTFQDLALDNRVVATGYGEASRQAALVIFHGVTQRFFPYWDVVDSDPDRQLMEALAREPEEKAEWTEEQTEYIHHVRSVRNFGTALMDSHGFFFNAEGAAAPPDFGRDSGRLPIFLDHTAEGFPLVRATNSPDFSLGDVITHLDGRPILEVIEDNLQIVPSSASSRMRNGVNSLNFFSAPRTFQVRSAEGTTRDVEVTPVPDTPTVDYLTRLRGPLDDLGHPELYYVDLNGPAMIGANVMDLHDTIRPYEGLVLDMRGYPNSQSLAFILELLIDGAPGARLQEVLQGPETRRVRDIPQAWPNGSGYSGPTMILAAPTTQSFAEHIILTLTSAGRVEVVGRPSAGANGTITSVALPGGIGAGFTGLVILQNDESVFHGRGVPIDHPITVLPEDVAAGIDPELQRAAELLAP